MLKKINVLFLQDVNLEGRIWNLEFFSFDILNQTTKSVKRLIKIQSFRQIHSFIYAVGNHAILKLTKKAPLLKKGGVDALRGRGG